MNQAHENNILRAYRLGIEHGQAGNYNPPQWIVIHMGLWLSAYQNGYGVGLRANTKAMVTR